MDFLKQIIFVYASIIALVNPLPHPVCQKWDDIIHKLILITANESSIRPICKKNAECTGIRCEGSYSSISFKGDLWITPCSNPIAIMFGVDAPDAGIHHRVDKLTEGGKFLIPIKTGLDSTIGKLYLRVTLQKTDDQTATFAMDLMSHLKLDQVSQWVKIMDIIDDIKLPLFKCTNGHFSPPPNPEFHNSALSPPVATFIPDRPGDRSCNLQQLFSCGRKSVCVQLKNDSTIGKCQCLDGYYFNRTSEMCTATEVIYSTPEPSHSQSNEKGYIIIVSTAVPIVALLCCAAFAFISVRFRWWQNLRSRFQARVYDQVLIGGPQDPEDVDPVV